ncbi:MAG: HlyD family efflux transporter periplasmic adaptor subunit [Lachnospiraceae bacterium]|nr:HlyD family efflux transporter periplasmic adaptor subunit [Lachnospiraceae bacterium]
MNENGTTKNKREWVKTAMIIFLTVMLILTFFSNTIMNYSLPEVATQHVQSGSITAKIRGTGVVESGDPYNVEVNESRKVKSVAVRVGDKVQKDDVLIYLDDTESEELKAAKDALEAAQDAYDLAILSAEVSADLLKEAGSNVSTRTYRQQITDAQTDVKVEQKKVDEWQERYDKITAQIANVPGNSANTDNESKALRVAELNKQSKDFDAKAAQNNVNKLQGQLDAIKAQMDDITVSEGDATWESLDAQSKQVQKSLREAQTVLLNAQSALNDATLAYERAETAYNNKVASGDTSGTITSLQNQQKSVEASLNEAKKGLEAKQSALTELISKINGVLGLQNQYEAVTKAQEEVQKQQQKSQNAVVVAEVAGTVTTLNVTAGQNTTPGTPVVVLQPEGKGFFMSFSVTNEQAKRLSVGDKADLVNAWRYDDVEVTLSSIKTDPQNAGQQKLLNFDVSGDVTPGQTLNVSVGQKSANYDLIVPNSAIREDNNGKFILIVESKSSPLGNRYIATRVDVEVLASDDTQSAISGGLYGWEFVITTSTKPVEAGKQVRLADN